MEVFNLLDISKCFKQNGMMLNCFFMILSTLLFVILVKLWINGGWCYSKATLTGKTIIITGANTGIGKEAARDFLERGARVILACRDLDKAVKAAREIEAAASYKGEVVVRELDLASFESIQKFAKEILLTEYRIDVLVNNAGLMTLKGKTDDGFDLVFGTNYLGHFLLTNLLLDKIIDSAPSRIINVSSLVHKYGIMHWKDLNLDDEDAYDPWKAYCQSKLANVLFTRELARRLKGTGVSVYALHPGSVRTEFGRYLPEFCPKILLMFISIFGPLMSKSASQGAQTTIYCAVSEDIQNQTGLYYSDCKEQKPGKNALDDFAAKRLWDMSSEMVELDEALSKLDKATKKNSKLTVNE